LANTDRIKQIALDYLTAVRTLALHPRRYFEESKPLPDMKLQFLAAVPPVVLYAAATAILNKTTIQGLAYVVGGYTAIVVWTAVLKYILIPFGEKRSMEDLLHIATSASMAFLVAWIPVAGPPIAVLLAGFWSFSGLVHYLKMNSGAAIAAVALPIVICGALGSILSFIFLGLASISTLFAR
jgi:hypothetical protein